MSHSKKGRFKKFLKKTVKYAAIFIVLYAAIRIPTQWARNQANEMALKHIYEGYRAIPEKPVTMFVPGMMASVLKDSQNGKVVYGNCFQGMIEELELPIDGKTLRDNTDPLIPTEVVSKFRWIPHVLEYDLNDRVRHVARTIGGYERGKDGFPFAWDWRRDMVEAAQQLDKAIEEIKKKKGRPDLKVNLLCHSAGGLVARYYAKYGGKDVLNDPAPVPTYAGAKNINKIIMMGTPNTGSAETFVTLHNGLWLPTIGWSTAEENFSMPALYELLPFDGKSVIVDSAGKPLPVDIYAAANWEKYGWSVFNPERQKKDLAKLKKAYGETEGTKKFQEKLAHQRRFLALVLDRAVKFHAALWAGDPAEEKEKIRYIVFGADREPTLKGAVVEPDGHGNWKTKFKAGSPEVRDAIYAYGDMAVTKDSFLGRHAIEVDGKSVLRQLPLTQSVFFFGNHVAMTTDITILDNVLHTIFEGYQPVAQPKRRQGLLQQLGGLISQPKDEGKP
jgi:pimeloyl-ACP methyl ester carboxylesterase